MAEQIITKTCTKCQKILPITMFYTHKRKGKTYPFGQCKTCYSFVIKSYRKTGKGKAVHRQSVKRYQQTEQGAKNKKEAVIRYLRTDKARQTRRKYYRKYYLSENGQKAYKKYRRSAKRRLSNLKYYRSKKGQECLKRAVESGRKKAQESWYRENHTLEVQARHAVGHAIENGFMPRADEFVCGCGKGAQEYHHHLGYEPEHWLDVIPLCSICHGSFHRDVILV